jgi:hypothetical protein
MATRDVVTHGCKMPVTHRWAGSGSADRLPGERVQAFYGQRAVDQTLATATTQTPGQLAGTLARLMN